MANVPMTMGLVSEPKKRSKRKNPDERFKGTRLYRGEYHFKSYIPSKAKFGVSGTIADARRYALSYLVNRNDAVEIYSADPKEYDIRGVVRFERTDDRFVPIWSVIIDGKYVWYVLKADGTLGRRL